MAFAIGVLVQLFNLQNTLEVKNYWSFKSVKIWKHFSDRLTLWQWASTPRILSIGPLQGPIKTLFCQDVLRIGAWSSYQKNYERQLQRTSLALYSHHCSFTEKEVGQLASNRLRSYWAYEGTIYNSTPLLIKSLSNIKVFAFSIHFLCSRRWIPAVLTRTGEMQGQQLFVPLSVAWLHWKRGEGAFAQVFLGHIKAIPEFAVGSILPWSRSKILWTCQVNCSGNGYAVHRHHLNFCWFAALSVTGRHRSEFRGLHVNREASCFWIWILTFIPLYRCPKTVSYVSQEA